MRHHRPIPATATIGLDLTRHRGRRSLQPRRDQTKRLATSNSSRDLFPLYRRQPHRTPLAPRIGTSPTRRNQLGADRRWRPTKTATDRPLRLASLPPIPQLPTLRNRHPFPNTPPQRRVSSKVLLRTLELTGWGIMVLVVSTGRAVFAG